MAGTIVSTNPATDVILNETGSGNTATCDVIVMVVDEVKPDADCVNAVVPLGTTNNGAITLTTEQAMVNGETDDDNCDQDNAQRRRPQRLLLHRRRPAGCYRHGHRHGRLGQL
jgi:hypothetical protein